MSETSKLDYEKPKNLGSKISIWNMLQNIKVRCKLFILFVFHSTSLDIFLLPHSLPFNS